MLDYTSTRFLFFDWHISIAQLISAIWIHFSIFEIGSIPNNHLSRHFLLHLVIKWMPIKKRSNLRAWGQVSPLGSYLSRSTRIDRRHLIYIHTYTWYIFKTNYCVVSRILLAHRKYFRFNSQNIVFFLHLCVCKDSPVILLLESIDWYCFLTLLRMFCIALCKLEGDKMMCAIRTVLKYYFCFLTLSN